MKSSQRRSIPSLLLICFAIGHAATVEQAILIAEPQMQVKDGTLQGCGYRIKAMPQDLSTSGKVILLDTSFNLYAGGMLGLLKGGAMQAAIRDGSPLGAPINRPIESFWIKSPGESPTSPKESKYFPAETKGYILYAVDSSTAAKLFVAVWKKSSMIVGARIKGESLDRIYSGTVQISEQDISQVYGCVTELIEKGKAEVESESQIKK